MTAEGSPTADDTTFAAAVNAEMARRGYRFGPISIERHGIRHPRPEDGWTAVDANGRRTRLGEDVDAERAVNALHQRHSHRIALDREVDGARSAVAELLGDLALTRVEAAYRDSLDAQRDAFMMIEVETTLLTPALRTARHRIDYRPYSVNGTNLIETRQTQRRRARRLGTGSRMDALACCAVLAARIAAGNPPQWRGLVANALADEASRKSPHFVDGVLMQGAELARGVWWSGGELRIGQALPQTIVNSLKGRPLASVVDHPWLPKDAVISHARIKGRSTEIRTPLATVPLRQVLDQIGAGSPND